MDREDIIKDLEWLFEKCTHIYGTIDVLMKLEKMIEKLKKEKR